MKNFLMMLAPVTITGLGAGLLGWFLIRREHAQKRGARAQKQVQTPEKSTRTA